MPPVPAHEEQAFYDASYSRFLDVPDGDLVCNRATLLAAWDNPAHPAWERRALYHAAMRRLLEQPLDGLTVLEYGCGVGDWGVMLAGEGARVTLLDLSPVAIQIGERRAAISGVAARVRGVARDATDLSCFASGEFDLVFGAFALHHTLKHPGSRDEVLRVLKPGGRLMLVETYGNNPVLNAARILRRWISREPAEQGEGIILSDRDLDTLRPALATVEVEPLNLLAMCKRFFRGRFENPQVRAFLHFLESTDAALLRTFPSLRRYCGEALIVGRKR